MARITFNVTFTPESDGSIWAQVIELPGCFASGFSLDEAKEATAEAIQLWLPDGIEFTDPVWQLLDDDKPKHRKPDGQRRRAPVKPRRQKMLVIA